MGKKFLLAISVFFFYAFVASAQVQISTNIPGATSASSSPGVFIFNFYGFAISLGGILAFGAIVYGGFKYAISAGNPSKQSDAKSWITDALWGLLLLFSAYLVLHTINPNLVNLNLPTLGTLSVGTGGGGGGGGCELAPLAPITDPDALAMENGPKVVWTSSDPNVQRNLTKLQQEFNKLQNAMTSQVGGSATPNSVYRPLAYQMHFWDIFQASQIYNSNPSYYDNNSACAQIVSALKAEQQKHGICYDGYPCVVATPSKCAPHVKGTGVDISISPASFLTTINTFLQANNIGLRWQALATDPVHFNLLNPPWVCTP